MYLLRTRVGVGRVLARVAPDTFGHDLVPGLVGRAWRQRVFRGPESRWRLAYAVEAVGLGRRLAAPSAGRHDGLLARALVVYAKRLSEVGRYREALDASVEAGVIVARRDAAATDLLGPGGELLVRSTALHGLARHEEALAAAEDAVVFFRRQVREGNTRAASLLYIGLDQTGRSLLASGRDEDAAATFAEALDEYRRLPWRRRSWLLGPEPTQVAYAMALSRLGRHETALPLARGALNLLDLRVRFFPEFQADRIRALAVIAVAHRRLGDDRKANAASEHVLKDSRARVAATETPASYAELAGEAGRLADVFWKLGDHAATIDLSGQAVACLHTAAERDPAYDRLLLRALFTLRGRLDDLGRAIDGVGVAYEAVAVSRRLLARDPYSYPLLAASLSDLGTFLSRTRRLAEAVKVWDECVALRREQCAKHPDILPGLVAVLADRSHDLVVLRRYDEAVDGLRELRDLATNRDAERLGETCETAFAAVRAPAPEAVEAAWLRATGEPYPVTA